MDEAVARVIISFAGGRLDKVFGKKGKADLRSKLSGYNSAAGYRPWLVLVDLDNDAVCAPALRQDWLAAPSQFMCFRIAVREVEAWLMADRESLADFLRIRRTRVPDDIEGLEDPKRTLVDLARESRVNAIRADLVPRPGSGRSAGPAYTSRLTSFAEHHWDVGRASTRSRSLSAAIACLMARCAAARDPHDPSP